MDRNAPIGVFDSGLGGMTVVRAIQRALPHEHIVYLGDTARVPYGTRSAETVMRYAGGCARRLDGFGTKLLVVACNTVSAVALDWLRTELDVPVLGVIVPGARAGVRASGSGRIGVIATAGTIASGAYSQAVSSLDTRAEVVGHAAPLLVPLAEEGWLAGEVPCLIARRYLEPLVAAEVDTLVLGCTHYPLLRPVIEDELARLAGWRVPVVDSAEATAVELKAILAEKGLAADPGQTGSLRILVTDRPGRFPEIASRFLGRSIEGLQVEQVDL